MQLVNPLEQQNAVKTLYSEFVSPVCAKYGLTRIELDILLFLANNTRYDTATDIVERTGTVWRGAVGWIYPRRAGAYAAQHGAHPQKRGKVSGG